MDKHKPRIKRGRPNEDQEDGNNQAIKKLKLTAEPSSLINQNPVFVGAVRIKQEPGIYAEVSNQHVPALAPGTSIRIKQEPGIHAGTAIRIKQEPGIDCHVPAASIKREPGLDPACRAIRTGSSRFRSVPANVQQASDQREDLAGITVAAQPMIRPHLLPVLPLLNSRRNILPGDNVAMPNDGIDVDTKVLGVRCNHCPRIFKTISHMQHHILEKHPTSKECKVITDTFYKCQLCNRIFLDQYCLYQHNRTKHQNMPHNERSKIVHESPLWKRRYERTNDLERNKKCKRPTMSPHEKDRKDDGSESIDTYSYKKCVLYKLQLKTKNSWKKHYRREHPSMLFNEHDDRYGKHSINERIDTCYECVSCKRQFEGRHELKQHIKLAHPSIYRNELRTKLSKRSLM